METFSVLLALCNGNPPVTGEFPSHRPVTRSFDVFFDECLDKWVEQTIETPVIRDAMRLNSPHCNVTSFSQVMDANSQSGTAMPTWCPGQLRTAFRRFQERSDETRSLNTGTCPYILYLPIICTRGVAVLKSCVHIFPEDTWRNDNVIITSQQRCYVFFLRHNDFIITSYPLGW